MHYPYTGSTIIQKSPDHPYHASTSSLFPPSFPSLSLFFFISFLTYLMDYYHVTEWLFPFIYLLIIDCPNYYPL